MHRSLKETRLQHPVSRALQLDYRASMEAAGMMDESVPGSEPERRPFSGIKQQLSRTKL